MKKIYHTLIFWMCNASIVVYRKFSSNTGLSNTLSVVRRPIYTCQLAFMFYMILNNSPNRSESFKNQWFNSKIKFWKAL